MFEKRDQLRQNVVERIATETGKGVEEVFEDKQLWETDQQYQTFLSSSLADSAIVLRNNMILDAHIGEKVKQSVMVLDQERDEILSRKEGEKDLKSIIDGVLYY